MNIDDHDVALAHSLGLQAFVYGFATVELYRVFWNEAVDPDRGHHDGVNQFHHVRDVATPSDTFIPSPNNDTLYSTAWLDLTAEPIVLSIPPIPDRCYWFPVGDFFHDIVTTLDWRSIGAGGGDVALVGPSWSGALPDGLDRVDISTPMAWILARTLTDGTDDDVEQVNRIQDRFDLTPLSAWSATPAPDTSIDYPDPALESDPIHHFAVLDDLLRRNPPRPADTGLVSTLGHIGIGRTTPFDASTLSTASAEALRHAEGVGRALLHARSSASRRTINGWSPVLLTGTFGTRYLYRAAFEFLGLLHGDDMMQAAFSSFVDADEERYDGAHRYELRFDTPPPADACWSLTMYDDERFLLVDNEIDRYSIGDRTPGLRFDPDGSLTVVLQHERPAGDDVANWLPTPSGGFYISIRAFNPTTELREGRWQPPPVHRVDAVT
ncbi:DUF1254 domain-containing protein [Ilumatobacter sp.]|uniref:DUF1254 domain-containing protein n=1 Tax=Ilumatobacter sp. TaxID=1967498 RepID=UPI003B525466